MREKHRRRNRSVAAALFALIAVTVLDAIALVTRAAAVTAPQAWVLERIAAGETADLEVGFPRASDRVLSAAFVRELLTRPATDPRIRAIGVVIHGATIRGRLDLRNEDVAHDTSFLKCRFEDDVVLSQARFRRSLVLNSTEFVKAASLRYANIAGNLEANKTQFHEVTFERMKVGGDVLLSGATFHASAEFTRAGIGGNLEADNVTFVADALFEGIRIRGRARFSDAHFGGLVDFRAQVDGGLDFYKAQFTDADQIVNFFSMKVGSNADLSETVFAGGFHLVKADVGGNLDLTGTQAISKTQQKKLNGLKADVLMLRRVQLEPPYSLLSVTYRVISGESPERLQRLMLAATDNTDALLGLEAFYQRQGQPEAAKSIHVARRRQERERLHGLTYAWNWLQDVFAGYGQYLERALMWSAVFILVGWAVFWRRDWMESQKAEDPEKSGHPYNPFWYSLALFLPISGLEDAKVWRPRRERWKTRLYMRLHIILGYLLIPIGLAAWTGIIK